MSAVVSETDVSSGDSANAPLGGSQTLEEKEIADSFSPTAATNVEECRGSCRHNVYKNMYPSKDAGDKRVEIDIKYASGEFIHRDLIY